MKRADELLSNLSYQRTSDVNGLTVFKQGNGGAELVFDWKKKSVFSYVADQPAGITFDEIKAALKFIEEGKCMKNEQQSV